MKTDDLFPFTGYTSDKKLAIYGNDFKFTFMENQYTTTNSTVVEREDNLIRGYSHSGNQIAIVCENELALSGYRNLNTYCAFLSVDPAEEKITEFNRITFSGGMLNTLFHRHSLDIDIKEGLGLSAQSDLVTYDFDYNNEKCRIEIWSSVTWSRSGKEGTNISNKEVKLSVCFTKMKPFSYAIECYHYICNCIRFMMNRFNIGFDSVTVSTTEQENTFEHNVFNTYFREDYKYTEKDGNRCITFDCLGKSITQLYLLFAASTNTSMNYSLGFFPKDDRDVYSISNDKIRSICAALEFEATKESSVFPGNNPVMVELITSAKECVKVFRKTHDDAISESTYSRIFSSMDYWSFSAKDKIQMLWNAHKIAMGNLTRHIQRDDPIDISIFVKYRNDITHGAEKQITDEVAAMAYVLRGLVYCCILKRIGLSENAIEKLCEYQINE